MSNTFCKYLSNQVRIEYGQLRPCCWFSESVDITDVEKVKLFLSEIDKINTWVDTTDRCNECLTRENKGLFSPRLESFNRHPLKNISDGRKALVEIQIDKDCNAACLICGPWNSTTWEKYENKIKSIPIQDISDYKTNTIKYIDQVCNSVDLSDASEILFLGGEPLKTRNHIELAKLVTNPSETILRYTTNGSIKPDSATLDFWAQFKRIDVQFSIDGIGNHFNYLRWPLQWHQVEDNILFLKSGVIPNINITLFSYTTTPFSLFYHDRYVEWANLLFDDQKFVRPWSPRGHTPMSLSATPINLQEAIREKYGSEHAISKLLEPYNPRQYKWFRSYIEQHDAHRRLNWRETFPEIVEYFNQ